MADALDDKSKPLRRPDDNKRYDDQKKCSGFENESKQQITLDIKMLSDRRRRSEMVTETSRESLLWKWRVAFRWRFWGGGRQMAGFITSPGAALA